MALGSWGDAPMRERFAVIGPQTAYMTASDGVRLDADIYRPDAPGDFPVLLMRQPYGRKIASTVVFAHPAWYASHGYIVAIQDVRGRGSSEGVFRLLADDVKDGRDAVAWAARLPGSTGKVGMYGFSYQGCTQLMALASGAPELAALCPAMMAWDAYADWAYEGGAFRFADGLWWGLQMATLEAQRAGDERAFNALQSASRSLPFDTARPYLPPVIEEFGQYGHYRDWIANCEPGDYWRRMSPASALAGKPMNVPMLITGGWFDFMLTGTLACFREAKVRSKAGHRLIVGPWTHIPWGRRVGANDFGASAVSDLDARQIAWFEHHLKGRDNGVAAWPDVELFDLTQKIWRRFGAWPEPPPVTLYLATDGRATVTARGTLGEDAATDDTSADIVVHDPWRPTPTMGGHTGNPGGMQERGAVDDRSDVATYTTAPLAMPVTLAGEVSVTLNLRCDQPSFDVSAVLSCVTSEGGVFNLTQGFRRIVGLTEEPVTIPMRALCATLGQGDALRLSLAQSDFPAFAVNSGSGAPPSKTRLIDNRVITLTITSGGPQPSRLDLPVVETRGG